MKPPQPEVLLLITNPGWFSCARLPRALAGAGFMVRVIAPVGHPVLRSRYATHSSSFAIPFDLDQFMNRFAAHLASAAPDLLVPCDDAAAQVLHEVWRCVPRDHPSRDCLARSLCNAGLSEALLRKSHQVAIAEKLGVAVPRHMLNPGLEDARGFAERVGWPVVLKDDFTCAGQGVMVCRSPGELLEAFQKRCPDTPFMAGARMVQEFVPGADRFVTVAADRGRMLGAFCVEKLAGEERGAASVVRHVDHPAAMEATRRLVDHFGLGGFANVEFRWAKDGVAPVFTEINPRATPVVHLGRILGADLCGLLAVAWGGSEVSVPSVPVEHRPIALFPNEAERDPTSSYIRTGFHDIPLDEPELMQS